MDRIHYAGDSVLTGTEIAKALLAYAEALALAGASATVEIPTRAEDGTLGRSTVLVGPASQLISDSEESDHEEITDPDTLAYLRHETDKLRRGGSAIPFPNDGDAQAEWADEF